MGYRSVHLPVQTHHIATQLIKRDLKVFKSVYSGKIAWDRKGEGQGKRPSILITKQTNKGTSLTTQCLSGDYFGLLNNVSHLLVQVIPQMFSSTNMLFGKHTEIKHFLLSKLSVTMMSAQHPCEVGNNQLFSETWRS